MKENKEQLHNKELSALFDGFDKRSSIADLSKEDRKTWEIYGLIGDALRQSKPEYLTADLATRVRDEIERSRPEKSNVSQFPLNFKNKFSFGQFKYAASLSFVFVLGSLFQPFNDGLDRKVEVVEASEVRAIYTSFNDAQGYLSECSFAGLSSLPQGRVDLELFEHHKNMSGTDVIC
jgi:hypothetical protein